MAADDGARRWMGGQAWLQAELFRIVFRCVSLNLFGDGECGSWPQQQIGVVLWSLSTTRHRWQNTFKLIKLSVLPDEAVLRTPEFVAPTLFVWRVLRPLRWFGLLECPRDPTSEYRAFWRKRALFDRFLRFDARVVSPTSATRGQNAHNSLISGSRKPKVGTTRPRAEGEDKGDSDADSRRGLGR